MDVGLFLGTQHPEGADVSRALDDHLVQTRAARDVGFSALWLAQHYLTYPDQFLQTTPLLARLAAETREKAMEEGGVHIAEKYRAYFSWGMGDNVPGESGKALSLEELARDRFVIGTPEDCIEACRAHRDELGCSHLIVRMNFPGMPQRNVINAIELFGREVLPHLN